MSDAGKLWEDTLAWIRRGGGYPGEAEARLWAAIADQMEQRADSFTRASNRDLNPRRSELLGHSAKIYAECARVIRRDEGLD